MISITLSKTKMQKKDKIFLLLLYISKDCRKMKTYHFSQIFCPCPFFISTKKGKIE